MSIFGFDRYVVLTASSVGAFIRYDKQIARDPIPRL